MHSKDMEKCFNPKTCQQIKWFSTLGSIDLINKYLFDLNNYGIGINNRYLMTNASKRQKSDENKSQNRYKSRRTQQMFNQNNNNSKTNYEILGINSNATQKQIKSAYYEKSKLCHPDLNQGSEAALQFRQVTHAYEVLSNNETKREYDIKLFGKGLRNRTVLYEKYENPNSNDTSFSKYSNSEDKTHDNGDYTQFWKNRRQRNNGFSHKNESKTDSEQKTYRYRDPLKYDPKEFFKHFNEEVQKEYAEQIRKGDQKYKESLTQVEAESHVISKSILTIFALIFIFEVMNELFDLNSQVVKRDKTNKTNHKNSKS
jgi:curved DNA-binding protein CbpA